MQVIDLTLKHTVKFPKIDYFLISRKKFLLLLK